MQQSRQAAADLLTCLAPTTLAGVSKRLPLKGVGAFAVCPTPSRPLVAAYVPEAKGSPAFIALYDYSAISATGDAPPPICRKSFYRVRLGMEWEDWLGWLKKWEWAGMAWEDGIISRKA